MAELRRPVYFYCTFAYEHAQTVLDDEKIEFFGESMILTRAPEVTDIIWENREVQKKEKCCRAFTIIFLMAFIFSIVMFVMLVFIKLDRIWKVR